MVRAFSATKHILVKSQEATFKNQISDIYLQITQYMRQAINYQLG